MNSPNPQPRRGSTNQNPAGIGLFRLLWEDYCAHDRGLLQPGLWAIWIHRFGNWRMGLPKLVRFPFTVLYRVLNRFMIMAFATHVPYAVKLGRRVRIWHHGGIYIMAESIGDDVQMRQNFACGIARRNAESDGLPVIGDRVDIYAGACIAGPVTVGHDAVIGANSVIVTDVEPGVTMIGNPARRMPGSPVLKSPAKTS